MAQLMARRNDALLQTQDGLRYVADQTGGFAVVNSNDIPRAFRRVLDDQRGYYLIGFQPSEDTFGADRRFRRVKVKVAGKGLRVRTRAGFYGVATNRSDQQACTMHNAQCKMHKDGGRQRRRLSRAPSPRHCALCIVH